MPLGVPGLSRLAIDPMAPPHWLCLFIGHDTSPLFSKILTGPGLVPLGVFLEPCSPELSGQGMIKFKLWLCKKVRLSIPDFSRADLLSNPEIKDVASLGSEISGLVVRERIDDFSESETSKVPRIGGSEGGHPLVLQNAGKSDVVDAPSSKLSPASRFPHKVHCLVGRVRKSE